ncbi:unnamed protein product [Pleuronectes platessa]|uniref:Uncharacterized protein n=1 Tax=Pleuronectes platessa TaxID=8262 RepID=A0A9N7Z7W5_PLEPL|nr:unnamed protein product [Pleuronectes platessa]
MTIITAVPPPGHCAQVVMRMSYVHTSIAEAYICLASMSTALLLTSGRCSSSFLAGVEGTDPDWSGFNSKPPITRKQDMEAHLPLASVSPSLFSPTPPVHICSWPASQHACIVSRNNNGEAILHERTGPSSRVSDPAHSLGETHSVLCARKMVRSRDMPSSPVKLN